MWTEITGAAVEELALRLNKKVHAARFQRVNDSLDLLEVDGSHYLRGRRGPIETASLLELTEDVLWRFRAMAK